MTQKEVKLDDYFLKKSEQYVHPNNFTGYSSGLYKITTNTNGHVTNAQSVSGADLPLHNHNSSISYGQVDSTSTSTVFTATVPNITALTDGTTVMLRNGVITSAEGFTLEVNGLGAKPVYNSMADATRDTTIFNINYTMLFVYDSTRVENGCWICYRGYNSDKDTNTIGYQLRTNSTVFTTTDKGYRYRLWLECADGKVMPVNTSTSTNATAKRDTAMNTRDFYLGGRIFYYSVKADTNANTGLTAASMWQQYLVTLGYSFNNTGSALVLTLNTPVYMVAENRGNGMGRLTSPYYTQTLPNTTDNKLYIYLGHAITETQIELALQHPIYEYKNNSIRLYRDYYVTGEVDTLLGGKSDTGHNHTVSNITDFPSTITPSSHTHGNVTNSGELTSIISSNINIGNVVVTNAKTNMLETVAQLPYSKISGTPSLANIATSGSYNDLADKPTIPSAYTHPSTHSSSMITDSNTHSNIGNTSNTLENIITNIDTKLGSLANVDLIEVTSSLGTASANTMNKLYLVAETTGATNDNYEVFVTVRTGTNGNYSYGWEKVDTARIDLSDYLTTTNAQQTYVAKESGKGLSSNDYTTTEKNKLAGLHTVATSGSYNDLTNKPTIPTVPTNVSAFTNDSGYLTSHQDISGKINTSDIVNNLTTSATGQVLDASQGKWLNDNKASSTHTHGNINNDGTITTVKTISSDTNIGADYFIIRENSGNTTKSANILDVFNKIIEDLIDEGDS